MKMNFDVLLLLKSLSEGKEECKEPWILHLDSEMLRGTRGSFVVSLIEAADLYINNSTK